MTTRSATRRAFTGLNLILFTALVAAACSPVSAAQDEALSAFEVCEKIDDEAEQLSCFRETLAGLKARESTTELPAYAPATARPESSRAQQEQPEAVVQKGRETVVQNFGPHEEALPVTEVEPRREPGETPVAPAVPATREEPEDVQDLHAIITALRRTTFGKIVATLDNGQVWRETDGSYYRGAVSIGNAVVISKRRFGGHQMKIADQPGVVLVRRSR